MDAWIVTVTSYNKVVSIEVVYDEKEADSVYVREANKWFGTGRSFETAEDVDEYKETDEFLDIECEANVEKFYVKLEFNKGVEQ